MSLPATLPPRFAAVEEREDVCARVQSNEPAKSQEINLAPEAISAFIALFRTLDAWDREVNLQ